VTVSGGQRWRGKGPTVAWLAVGAVGCAALLVAIDVVFVHTTRGQWVDDAALRGTTIGRSHIIDPVSQILNVVSVTALGVATITVGVVGFLRRRPTLALLAMLLVVGSTVSTELIKHLVFTRPLLDPAADQLQFNTLPSGHTTVALSVGVAMTLVAPATVRVLVSVIGVTYGAATGVATMSAGWHRPSDAVAACLVVGTWTAIVGLIAVLHGPGGERLRQPNDTASNVAVVFFWCLAGLLLVIGTAALVVTASGVPQPSSRPRLFLAYAGGASAVAGTAFAVMAGLLSVVRRAGVDALDSPRQSSQPPRVAHRMAG
jgi:hypothetical protein